MGNDNADVSRETETATENIYPRYSPVNGWMSGESTLVIQFQNINIGPAESKSEGNKLGQ